VIFAGPLFPGKVRVSVIGSPVPLTNVPSVVFKSETSTLAPAVVNKGRKNTANINRPTFFMEASSYHPVLSKSLDYSKRKAPEEP